MPWAILAAVLVLRIPAIVCPSELNVDESLLAAQGMRYASDVVPWRSVDTTTSGPVNCLPFAVAHRCLHRLTYRGIHLMAAALQAAIVLATWATLRRTTAPVVAMLATANALLFVAFAQKSDYVHFSSELMPAALVSFATYCVARGGESDARRGRGWWLAAALLAGTAPWAKLQAAPISVVLFFFSLLHAWRGSPPGRRPRRLAAVAVAFLLPSAVILGIVWWGAAWQDFWQSYVARNVLYARERPGMDAASRLAALVCAARPTRAVLLGEAVFAAAWCWYRCPGWRSLTATRTGMPLFAAGSLAAAIVAVIVPPWRFPHYEWLLVQPATVSAAFILDAWHGDERRREARARSSGGPSTSLACFATVMVGLHLTGLATGVRDARDVFVCTGNDVVRRVTARITTVAGGAGTLGVWGWAPMLYVETGMAPATRHAIGHYLIDDSPQRDFFRAAYLADLKAAAPSVFVDAVAPGFFVWRWSEKDRIDSFSDLDRFVHERYRLADEIRLTPDAPPARVYVRISAGGTRE